MHSTWFRFLFGLEQLMLHLLLAYLGGESWLLTPQRLLQDIFVKTFGLMYYRLYPFHRYCPNNFFCSVPFLSNLWMCLLKNIILERSYELKLWFCKRNLELKISFYTSLLLLSLNIRFLFIIVENESDYFGVWSFQISPFLVVSLMIFITSHYLDSINSCSFWWIRIAYINCITFIWKCFPWPLTHALLISTTLLQTRCIDCDSLIIFCSL